MAAACEAGIYPLLGRRVETPHGPGKLWQVFEGRLGVVLDADPSHVTFLGTGTPVRPLPEQPLVLEGGGA